MPKKEKLLEKLTQKNIPKNFTTAELDALMGQCGCTRHSGGRGSAIMFIHTASNRKLVFDGPHPGKELYGYQIKMVRKFLKEIGELGA